MFSQAYFVTPSKQLEIPKIDISIKLETLPEVIPEISRRVFSEDVWMLSSWFVIALPCFLSISIYIYDMSTKNLAIR